MMMNHDAADEDGDGHDAVASDVHHDDDDDDGS